MPIYEYRCEKCRCDFELFIWSAKDEKNLECPKCGHQKAKRIMSACRSKSGFGGGPASSHCGPSSGGFS